MSNPWIIIFWLSTLALSAVGGWLVRADHDDAKTLRVIASSTVKSDKSQDAVDTAGVKRAGEEAVQIVKDRIITREVIRYVQVTPVESRVVLPGTWRVRHDAAATGTPAESESGSADPAAPVTDAAALDTVAENYTSCRGYIRQLNGWIDYWESVKDLCRRDQ